MRKTLTAVLGIAWVAAGAVSAATPYQTSQTPTFNHAILIQGHPRVFVSADMEVESDLIDKINRDIRECRGGDFFWDMQQLERGYAFNAQAHKEFVREVNEAKATADYWQAEAERLFDHSHEVENIDESIKEWQRGYDAQKKAERARRLISTGDRSAEIMLQDLNTLQTIIGWLHQVKFDCTPPPPPPPPPIPPSDMPYDDPNCPIEVIEEINRARTNPQAYADAWPHGDQESLDFLRRQTALLPVDPNQPLEDAAERLANDPNAVDHTGSDGSRPMQRIHDAGLFSTITAEVIAKEQRTPEDAVHQLITDLGNPTKPHRSDLFNPNFTLIGVACALDRPHPVIVIDLSNPPMKREN